MNQTKYKAKKLFNGFASVRDYIIKKAIKSKSNLVIEFDGKEMTIPLSELEEPFQMHKREFISKYNGTKYELYDFKFVPNNKNQMELLWN